MIPIPPYRAIAYRAALPPHDCGTARWRGASGTEYDAEIYPLGLPLPPAAGVVLLARPRCWRAQSWIAIHVGQSANVAAFVRDEMRRGRNWGYAVEQGMTAVHIVRVEGGAALRFDIERDLVGSLLPVLNGDAAPRRAGAGANLGVTM